MNKGSLLRTSFMLGFLLVTSIGNSQAANYSEIKYDTKSLHDQPVNDSINPVAVFDQVWQIFNTNYPYFEQRGIDWQALYKVYRLKLTPKSTEKELFSILCRMLGHLNDGHVNLNNGKTEFNSGPTSGRKMEDFRSKGAESITIRELRDHVFFLASDSMNGRETGSLEFLSAARYCAAQFGKAGIIPIDPRRTGEEAYFQDVPYVMIRSSDGRTQMGLDTAKIRNDKRYFSPNTIGIIRGTDPKLADQYIVIGAHLDHIGNGSNGADDNASGCAGVIEIAEALALDPPKRSVLLVLFSGEEKGLLGSGYFVENCTVNLESIKGMINLDMIGRTASKYDKERTHFIAGLGDTGSQMLSLVEKVNSRTLQWPLKRLTTEDGRPGGSDHARFAKKGIPAVFFFSGEHADLHAPTDDPEKIDYEKMQAITQLAYEVTWQLANKSLKE